MENCVFCKIASGEIRGLRVYEDETTLAFMDLAGDFDGHILVIPKQHYKFITDCPEETARDVWATVRKVSIHLRENFGYDGVDLLSANSPASQSLPHLHVHIIPRKTGDGLGEPGQWPVPKGAKEDVCVMYERLRMI